MSEKSREKHEEKRKKKKTKRRKLIGKIPEFEWQVSPWGILLTVMNELPLSSIFFSLFVFFFYYSIIAKGGSDEIREPFSAPKIWERRKQLQFIEEGERVFESVYAFWLLRCWRFVKI